MRLATPIAALLCVSLGCLAATSGTGSLVEAIKNQDMESTRALIKQHVDVNAAEPDGTTPLHWAAHWNDLEMTELLLRSGANAKVVNRYGVTPLAEASRTGSAPLIEALLKAGADPDSSVTVQGETALMRAARDGNVDAVKVLLEHGANPDARENYRGQTALMWAAAEGHPDVIKLLIAKGADTGVRSMDRDTTAPKMEAGTPIAPIPHGGLAALHFAARQGQMEAAKALLDGGADINEQDSEGNTPLVLAILNEHFDLAQLLIDRKADPNLANKEGRAALYTAVDVHDADWSPRPARHFDDKLTSMDVIHSLLDHGAQVNQRLTDASPIHKQAQDAGDRTLAAGATPFMRSARSADLELMRLLLDKGADPKLANKDGLNALMLAAGASWSDKIRGTEAEALEAVKLCVEKGLDVNAANDKKETALHGAAHRGADSIIKYLAAQGANVNAANKRGLTPLDIAMGKGGAPGGTPEPHETTAEVLKQLGGSPGKEIKETAQAQQP